VDAEGKGDIAHEDEQSNLPLRGTIPNCHCEVRSNRMLYRAGKQGIEFAYELYKGNCFIPYNYKVGEDVMVNNKKVYSKQ
jgi:hypothetical protein